MTQRIIPCQSCVHLDQERMRSREGAFCNAFPDGDGIPEIVIMGRMTHRTPIEGDHGIRWTPRPGHEHDLDNLDVTLEPFPLSPLGN